MLARRPAPTTIQPEDPTEAAFSTLAGELTEAPADGEIYRVRNAKPLWMERTSRRTVVLAFVEIALEIGFVVWLLQSRHFPHLYGSTVLQVGSIAVTASIALMEVLRLINVISLAIASVTARNPVPVRPQNFLRVAFLTTIVPSKEPIDVVRRTLIKAKAIRYAKPVDVWLLDEGDDPEVRRMCAELKVNHFTRKDVEAWNQPSGPYKTKSKHGNYNSWLQAHGADYDIFGSVDPDHAPTPNYMERMLGYFRDPDIAFVTGPQNYANGTKFVTAAAESQQFPFHAIIQRAANRAGCSMLVGTNNALRISALESIGGLRDSVTEDMATGLYFHTSRNPSTGHRWRSVYTPDVLAHGEGPTTWTDFFSQQMRWSRGTFEVIKRDFWRRVWRLGPDQLLHYGLLMTYYPSMAISWSLGAVCCAMYMIVGASGFHVPAELWLALYVDTTATQIVFYVSNRRYNVSPYDVDSFYGLTGMLIGFVATPLYAASMFATIFGRPARFVVTPKGASSSGDSLWTFRRHLLWAGLLASFLLVGLVLHHATPVIALWPLVVISVCLLPVAISASGMRDARRILSDRPIEPIVETVEEPSDERLAEPVSAPRDAQAVAA